MQELSLKIYVSLNLLKQLIRKWVINCDEVNKQDILVSICIKLSIRLAFVAKRVFY